MTYCVLSMKEADKNLCEAVISPGEEIGRVSFVKVSRDGSLLLALPLSRKLALATLGLYQPQRWKGRLLKRILRVAILLDCYKLLPTVELSVGSHGIFSGLCHDVDHKKFGFLLGNAESRNRNLIGVLEIGDVLHVVKAGSGSAAAVVKDESRRMREFNELVSGVPTSLGSYKIEKGAAYVAERIGGKSPRGKSGDNLVLQLLVSWLKLGTISKVSSLECWKSLESVLNEHELSYFIKLSDKKVVSPVMHGDFAPWNIKVNKSGELKVLDWEYAVKEGMPMWDWLHYHVQRMRLVESEPAEQIVNMCRELLFSGSAKTYLDAAGLLGSENEILGSYLYFSGRVHSYEREDLIMTWKSSVAGEG